MKIVWILCWFLELGVQGLTPEEEAALTASGEVSLTNNGANYRVSSDGLPPHETGTFPNPDNPNVIQPIPYNMPIPTAPNSSFDPSTARGCTPMGPIGMSISGIPMFNPLTINVENAVEGPTAEVFDDCEGHPDPAGAYHYHQESSCLVGVDNDDQLMGIAIDGFPIYSKWSGGVALTSDDLDECHGRHVDGAYRYHLTDQCPYIIGCFRGTIDSSFEKPNGECHVVTPDTPYCTSVMSRHPDDELTGGGPRATAHVSLIGAVWMACRALVN